MVITPTALTNADVFLSKEGISTLRLTCHDEKTVSLLIPVYLTRVLLVLVRAHLDCEEPNLYFSECLRTAKQLQQTSGMYLESSSDIGSYIYKLRIMITNSCSNEGISVTAEDFIVSKNGWGYGVHPDIHLTMHSY